MIDGPAIGAGYTLGRRVGTGATATVHLARRLADGQAVVVKRAHPTPRARAELHREAQVLDLLRRSGATNVVRLVERLDDAAPEAHVRTTVAALVLVPAGTPLAAVVGDPADDGPSPAGLDPVAITTVLLDLADALASIHAAGVTHNDVSLANVVLADDGGAVLIDFAAAAGIGGTSTAAPGRAGVEALGTVPYLAPERLRGAPPAPAADVCALARLGFRLWLGAVPPVQPVQPVQHVQALVARGCAPVIATVLVQAAADDPALRPSAAEVAGAIRRTGLARRRPPPPTDRRAHRPPLPITRDFGPRPTANPADPAGGPTGGRLRLAAAVAATVAVAIAIGAGALTWSATGDRPGERATRPADRPAPLDVTWDRARAEARVATPDGTRRFRLGQPGDHLVVGDWDGDGEPTPAVFRPSTGELFLFRAWAAPDQPPPTATAQLTGIVGGRPTVRRIGRRDVVEVRP